MREVLESVWSQSSRRRVFSSSREHYKRVGSCWCSVSARKASSSADGECTDTSEAPGGGEVPSKGETRKASGKRVVKKGMTKAKAASSSTAAAGQEQEVSSKRSRHGCHRDCSELPPREIGTSSHPVTCHLPPLTASILNHTLAGVCPNVPEDPEEFMKLGLGYNSLQYMLFQTVVRGEWRGGAGRVSRRSWSEREELE